MNITLRKASALQNRINETIADIKINPYVTLNEFQNPNSMLLDAKNALFENDTRRQRLLLTMYTIRSLVAAANAASGVDLKLATAAYIDKRIVQLNELANLQPQEPLSVIEGQLAKLKAQEAVTKRSMYGYDDGGVKTTVIDDGQIKRFKQEILNLKKQKQGINDEVLALNIKTEIPLSEESVGILTAEGLL
jgi:hypothetical protein